MLLLLQFKDIIGDEWTTACQIVYKGVYMVQKCELRAQA